MSTVAKRAKVEQLRSFFESSEVVILSQNVGLNVSAANSMRKSVRSVAGGRCFCAKRTLLKIALKGTKYESLSRSLVGSVVVACGDDPVAIAKAVVKFSKSNERLQVVAGADSKKEFDIEHINALASLPSFDEVRAKLLSLLQAPGSQIARAIALYAEKKVD